jgi:hypothetical protein
MEAVSKVRSFISRAMFQPIDDRACHPLSVGRFLSPLDRRATWPKGKRLSLNAQSWDWTPRLCMDRDGAHAAAASKGNVSARLVGVNAARSLFW